MTGVFVIYPLVSNTIYGPYRDAVRAIELVRERYPGAWRVPTAHWVPQSLTPFDYILTGPLWSGRSEHLPLYDGEDGPCVAWLVRFVEEG